MRPQLRDANQHPRCTISEIRKSNRLQNMASNLLFILYGMLGHTYQMFFLHLPLLPIKLVELNRT